MAGNGRSVVEVAVHDQHDEEQPDHVGEAGKVTGRHG